MRLLERYRDVDVFCLQEILKGGDGKTERGENKSLYEDIVKLLKEHTGYFLEYIEDGAYYGESSKNLDFKFGIACFVKNTHEQSLVGEISLYDSKVKWGDYDGRLAVGTAQAVRVVDINVVNAHGVWQGSTKGDSEVRVEQSRRIIDLANITGRKKIICGDLNVSPETECLKMIENMPMKNLTKEYGVTSTRTTLNAKDSKFADYILVSKNIKVNNFKVLSEEVSDHCALYVDFE